LLQTKLEIEPGSLTDGSAGLWKTLRVWSESVDTAPDALLVLITTASAPDDSIAALLSADDRDDERAQVTQGSPEITSAIAKKHSHPTA
jgi:hypothetical protein